jgi:hypothetical protein
MTDVPAVVAFVHLRCPRHRRMKPLPGVTLTLGRRWQDCRECRTVWREGMGPGARRGEHDAPRPRPHGWPGRS